MNMQMEMLRTDMDVLDKLEKDGWELDTPRQRSMRWHHPKLTDEFETRRRLHQLGLLTSRAFRIDLGLPETPR